MDSDEQILRNALDILRRDGWCKSALQDATGKRCAMGALVAVPGSLSTGSSALESLDTVSLELFPNRLLSHLDSTDLGRGLHTIGVNNHPDTTFEDIEVIFEKAAIRTAEVV